MKHWSLWLGLAISLISLALVFHGVEWKDIYESLRQAEIMILSVALVLIIAVSMARTARWSVLLIRLRKNESFARLFAVLNIGYFLNNILPARAGDVARACLWGMCSGASKAATLSTIVLEHLIDLCAIFFCFLILLPFVFLPNYALWLGLASGIFSIVLITLLVFIVKRQSFMLRIVAYLPTIVPVAAMSKIEPLIFSLMEGLLSIKDLRQGIVIIFWTVIIYLSQIIFIYLVFCSLRMDATFMAAITVMVFTSLGMVIPSAPGNLGVYHLAVVSALGLFGMGGKQALGCAILLHGLSYVMVSFLGIFSFFQVGISFRRIVRFNEITGN